MIFEASDLKVNGYIRFTVPHDYHEYRYGRIHKITNKFVYVVSWYDCFIGYEYLKVPYRRILEYKDKFIGIAVEDDRFQRAINEEEEMPEWLKKCITCKHAYKKKNDGDTIYCRLRECKYKAYKEKENNGNGMSY